VVGFGVRADIAFEQLAGIADGDEQNYPGHQSEKLQ